MRALMHTIFETSCLNFLSGVQCYHLCIEPNLHQDFGSPYIVFSSCLSPLSTPLEGWHSLFLS
eukprot:TRINITY_DN2027_c0_g1_i2.p1 TRINITY_DN2027_c0_g1~~TRINITY_DN2027_c0_g1_i2.p1  ORF type:complete len:63 (-),score=0.68 TRINITY_DN2027_c0_g1_i2:556-744(-)